MIGLHHTSRLVVHQQAKRHQQQHNEHAIRIQTKTAPQIASSAGQRCRNSQVDLTIMDKMIQDYTARHPNVVRPQQQQQQSGRGRLAKDQVLLIVQDEDNKGIPVIGRRVPLKSIAAYQMNSVEEDQQQLQQVSRNEPVLGRRSHRLNQHNQLYTKKPFDEYNDSTNEHLYLAEKHQQKANFNDKHYSRQSLSATNVSSQPPVIEAYNLPPMVRLATESRYLACEPGRVVPSSQSQQKSKLGKSPILVRSSEDYSLAGGANCCLVLKAAPGGSNCCCQFDGTFQRAGASNDGTRSSSCQRVPFCCNMDAQNLVTSCHSSNSKRLNNYHQSSELRPTRGSTKQNQHSCQSNVQATVELGSSSSSTANKQTSRSSSCHDNRRSRSVTTRCNNILPVVHPKPNLSSYISAQTVNIEHQRQQQQARYSLLETKQSSHHQLGGYESSEAVVVGQMYESLAAELKAKLGDPKLAPILLPPKDYDTISRKQGKLNGIELRRSTNPQLVGPSVNNRPQMAPDNQQQLMSVEVEPGASGGSARSSGRSQDNEQSLSQVSRSNSSSGLGSISMSANSPTNSSSNESPSNEPMRCGRHNFKLKEPERKNCSPDTCGGSDSGHSSENTRLDNSLCGEQNQKLLCNQNSPPDRNYYNQQHNQAIIMKTTNNQSNNNACNTKSANLLSTKEEQHRGKGIHNYNPSKVSDGVLWNGRVEIPLKINSNKNDGNIYLATKQIFYE